jgi:hypothetical protein
MKTLQRKAIQAKDLDTRTLLAQIWAETAIPYSTVSHWTLQEKYYPEIPERVVRAKCSKLSRQGLVDGCDCGCRGDWRLTYRGSQAIEDGQGASQ